MRTALAASIVFLALGSPDWGAEPAAPAPAETPPSVILDETFQTNLLSRVKTIGAGQFTCRDDRLILTPKKEGDGTPMGLVYAISAGPVAQLTAGLVFPAIEDDPAIAETRLGILLQGRRIIHVVFSRKRTGRQMSAELRLVHMSDLEQVLRVFPLSSDVSSGEWTVEYHHGLVRVAIQGRKTAQGFVAVRPIASPIVGVSLTQRGGPVQVQRLRVAAAIASQESNAVRPTNGRPENTGFRFAPPDITLLNTNKPLSLDETRRQLLQDAAHARERATQYHSQARHQEAVGAALECCALLQRAHGRQHPDVAADMVALARALDADGRRDEALKSLQEALRIQEAVLGASHPHTATVRAALADVLAAQGKSAEACAQYKAALPVYESVFGPDDPRTESLRKRLLEP